MKTFEHKSTFSCNTIFFYLSGTMNGIANINIPIKDGMFSMQPNAITDVDSDLVSRIDNSTIRQLKQLQANLAVVMNTFRNKK